MAEEKIVDFPVFRFLAANGDWRWIESRLINQLDNIDIKGFIINSRDVTSKKKDQDVISMLSKIVQETPNIIITTDVNEQITWVNTAFEKITGYSFQEVKGANPGKLLQGPDTSPDTVALMKRMIALRLLLRWKSLIIQNTKSLAG